MNPYPAEILERKRNFYVIFFSTFTKFQEYQPYGFDAGPECNEPPGPGVSQFGGAKPLSQ